MCYSTSSTTSSLAKKVLRLIGEEVPRRILPTVPSWKSCEVQTWLQQIGFNKYCQRFLVGLCAVGGHVDGHFCPTSQLRCKCLTQLFQGPLQPGFLLAGSPGRRGYSPEADRARAAEGFGDGLQHHSEKVGSPPGHTGPPQGHHHSGRARGKVSAFPFLQKTGTQIPQVQNLDCQGFSTALLQYQRDFCNGTTAQQRCG